MCLLLLAAPAPAQEVVAVPVAVTGSGGRPIVDLEVRDFAVRDGGNPVLVERLQLPDEPVRIAVVVDSSPRQDSDIGRTRDDLRRVLDALDAAHPILLVEAQTDAVTRVGLTTDRQAVDAAIDALEPTGRPTNRLIDAATEAFVALLDAGSPRGALILITDGVDVGSDRGVEDFRRVLRVAAMPLYVLAVDNFEGFSGGLGARTAGAGASAQFRGALESLASRMEAVYDAQRDNWRSLAEESGGAFFDAGDAGFSAPAGTLAARLQGTYTLYYRSEGGGPRPLDVRVERPGAAVHHPATVGFGEGPADD